MHGMWRTWRRQTLWTHAWFSHGMPASSRRDARGRVQCLCKYQVSHGRSFGLPKTTGSGLAGVFNWTKSQTVWLDMRGAYRCSLVLSRLLVPCMQLTRLVNGRRHGAGSGMQVPFQVSNGQLSLSRRWRGAARRAHPGRRRACSVGWDSVSVSSVLPLAVLVCNFLVVLLETFEPAIPLLLGV